ncbi:MAG: hypothetical protein ACREOB_00480 [Thermodesulfobacteriota bacterium]
MATLTGANTTAQWYADNYSSSVFSRLDKFVVHTTETGSRTSVGWPGYSSGASAPNATYDPRGRVIRQHFPNNESSRALRDPSGTVVRENRDNVFQLEIICYSQKSLAIERGGLWVCSLTSANYQDLARMIEQLNRELGLPLQSSVTWGSWTNGAPSSIRLSGPGYDAYRGILGHMHVSGNTHWDPGAFSWTKLKAQLGETDMPLDAADLAKVKAVVLDALITNRSWISPSVSKYAERIGASASVSQRALAEYAWYATAVSPAENGSMIKYLTAKLDALTAAVAALANNEDLSAEEMTAVINAAIANAVIDVDVTVKDETTPSP